MRTLFLQSGHTLAQRLTFAFILYSSASNMSAQTDPPAWKRWLDSAEPIPELRIPNSKEEWEVNRRQIQSRLWQLLGRIPPRPARPNIQTISREEHEDYVIEKFKFDNEAGAIVPGYLFLPKQISGKIPGILYCHWHGGEYDNGKEELLRAEHTPSKPGPAWAARGYAVLGIDAYCFGERNGQGPGGRTEKGATGEMTASKFNLWIGRTLWGMILRDDLMALDYLLSRPEVDSQRVAVTGISMGATRSWWLMALDERIRAGVAVACLTHYQSLITHQGLKSHGIYYYVPGLLNHFDTDAIVSLIAPRPILFQTGDQDEGSPIEGVRIIEKQARQMYRLYQAEDEYQSIIYPGIGHVYLPEMWQKTLAWIDDKL